MTTHRVSRPTTKDDIVAAHLEAVAAQNYAVEVIQRAIQTICTFAEPIKSWGGGVPCDWVEYELRDALDAAFPERLEERESGYASRRGRPKMSAALRTRVFERDAYRCVFCASHIDLQVDHIHPVSKGGGNEFENLQTLCKPCNREKFDKVPE